MNGSRGQTREESKVTFLSTLSQSWSCCKRTTVINCRLNKRTHRHPNSYSEGWSNNLCDVSLVYTVFSCIPRTCFSNLVSLHDHILSSTAKKVMLGYDWGRLHSLRLRGTLSQSALWFTLCLGVSQGVGYQKVVILQPEDHCQVLEVYLELHSTSYCFNFSRKRIFLCHMN